MHYKYQPYPYYRRYYNLDPYYYRRYYYNPYYNYQQNIIDSQVSDIDQNIVNYGDMTDVYQDANVYQSRASLSPTPEPPSPEPEPVEVPPVEEPTNPSTEVQIAIPI